jgi:hypothetical protein
MKIKILVAGSVLLLALSSGAFAMDKGGKMGGHDMGKGGKMGDMDHSGHMGDMVHESKSGMYKIAYHLIDNMAQMAKMDKKMDMSEHKGMKSNHLMTYFVGHDGKNTTGGKVGYMIVGPDGAKQKAMAMGMKGGYGADVDLKAKGQYTIKTKAVFGEDTVMDEFSYEVK